MVPERESEHLKANGADEAAERSPIVPQALLDKSWLLLDESLAGAQPALVVN